MARAVTRTGASPAATTRQDGGRVTVSRRSRAIGVEATQRAGRTGLQTSVRIAAPMPMPMPMPPTIPRIIP